MTTRPRPADPAEAATVHSFAPIEGERSSVLVLGTMPGVASLQAVRYYAHPRNAFWPILLAWLDRELPDRSKTQALPYPQRVARLRSAGIAVWDVLAHCHRPGSLDSAIVGGSEAPNDIEGFVHRHPGLVRIVFNGRTAAKLFDRHVSKPGLLTARTPACSLHAAPSTSPAMASLSLEDKYRSWCAALGPPPDRQG